MDSDLAIRRYRHAATAGPYGPHPHTTQTVSLRFRPPTFRNESPLHFIRCIRIIRATLIGRCEREASMPSIELEGINTEYTVIRHPRRRHVQIQVLPGRVTARVPQRFADRRVPDILRRRAAWIRLNLALLEGAAAATRRQYVTSERFPYLGKTYVLKVIYDDAMTDPSVELSRGLIQVLTAMPTGNNECSSTVRSAILRWYRLRAMEYLPERVEKLGENFGMHPSSVTVKDQKSRWGSCSSSGSVSLNWRLVLTPIHIVDYVVAHELCHLKIPNHSPEFWRLLADIDPLYAQHRRWLKANSIRLGLWLSDPRPT